MSSKNTMTRDAMFFLPAKVIEGLLIILCSSLYTHIFQKDAVGVFNTANTTVQLAYLVLAGWMANASTRYVAGEHEKDGGRALFSTVTTIYCLIGAAVAGVCLVCTVVTGDPVFLAGTLMFLSYTAFQVLNAALIQLGRVRASILWSLTSAVLKVAVAYGVIGGASEYPSAYPAILANTLADGVAALGAVLALGLPAITRLRFFSKPLLGRFFAYGAPLMGVSISVALLNTIDRYLVIGFFGQETFAVYSSNNSIASGVFTMLSVGIMRGVYPAVLRAWRDGGKAEALPLLSSGVRLYLLVALPAVFGLAAVALPLSQTLFAQGYETGAPVIAMTALAMLMMGLTEYANKAYELEQATGQVLQNSVAAAVVKVISSLLLMRAVGFTGGALGSVVAFTTYFVLTAVRVRKRFLFHLPAGVLLRLLGSAALCGGAAYAATLLPLSSPLRLACGVAAGSLTYAVAVILSGEAREEWNAVCRRLRRGR